MLSPELRRELIRLANRDGMNSTEVEVLIEFGMYAVMRAPLAEADPAPDVARILIDLWKESFDEP